MDIGGHPLPAFWGGRPSRRRRRSGTHWGIQETRLRTKATASATLRVWRGVDLIRSGRVHSTTRPSEEVITEILRRRWGLGPVELDYLPVGFSSYHWQATDAAGRAWFLPIDDLHKSHTSTPDGTLDAAHERLARAYRSAYTLRHRGGLEFVVAPVADRDGLVIARVSEDYSIIVQPHLSGQSLGGEDFVSWTDRAEIVGILARLHGATDLVRLEAGMEVGFLSGRDELLVALDTVGTPWTNGPYGQQARALLDRHAAAVEGLLEHCERGAVLVTDDPDTMVLTLVSRRHRTRC